MAKIIQFNSENEESHSCPTCDLILNYIEEIVNAETPEQLWESLEELVLDAKDLGVKEYLIHDIDSKVELLEYLENSCDCDQ